MADTIPGNSSTTKTVTVGSTTSGTLETIGDHDWFKITLAAGQSINVTVDGITLEDSYLTIRNSSGSILYENDDIVAGVQRDSSISFTASTSGTYYIDVGSWENSYAGTYQLVVSNYAPPPAASVEEFAEQLTTDYWYASGDRPHHFNVTQGGTIRVDLSGLTAQGQVLAEEALDLWSDIIGVNFVQVTAGAQITFDDNEEGAWADSSSSGGFTTTAHVNVSTQWLADYAVGTNLNTYAFQTYIHEVGHALGLGHAGNYNSEATYPYDSRFVNDSWSMSVMSYFDQRQNTYFRDQGFTLNYIATPMMADIFAMSQLYGLSTTTRADNTTYGSGWHTNMGALCIFDSAGIDTIDVSGMGGNQLINLNPCTFSNIMGEVGNVSIAPGVIIENARTSSGTDTLIGNDASNRLESGGGNDTLDGGAGHDIMYGGTGNDTYVVDHESDSPMEELGEGTDTVLASRAHTLKANVEHLTMTGIYSIHGRGNDLANTITGNSGSNRMWGEAGNDTLIGNEGSDQLDGGAGADLLTGGLGNDIYFVDSVGDQVVETAGGGRDTVRSIIDWILGGETEWLELQGGSSADGTGNAVENVMRGNDGANTLLGLGDNDKIYAGAGNDTVDGGAGDDWLEGESGRDFYLGGSGSDRFVFREGDFGGASAATADVIHDFGDADGDRIHLSVVDANGAIDGDQAFAFLGTGAFTGTRGELRYEQISGNTFVQGDINGDGLADFWIRLDGLYTLGTDDFVF